MLLPKYVAARQKLRDAFEAWHCSDSDETRTCLGQAFLAYWSANVEQEEAKYQ